MFISVSNFLFIIVPVLVNVAFFTLLERKILGLSQFRKGPNKVSSGGLLQPMADAVKLFSKEYVFPQSSNSLLYLLSPASALMLVLLTWSLVPSSASPMNLGLSFILLLVLLGLGLYPLLIAGWASNSKYASIGALRGVAQTISYEISLALLLLTLVVLSGGLTVNKWLDNHAAMVDVTTVAPVLSVWLVSCVAETNRSPFDFAEGESELVSGFNVEYGASGFALIFMAEYASILFLSLLSGALISGSAQLSVVSVGAMIIVGGWWVWLRATYPRFRYDKLMALAWKAILPLALSWTMLSFSMMML